MPLSTIDPLAISSDSGVDVPATLKTLYKDIPAGTMALMTFMNSAGKRPAMVHVTWRTMSHEQPSDMLTIDEAGHYLGLDLG